MILVNYPKLLFLELEIENEINMRQGIQTQLNKTTKFSHKPINGNLVNEGTPNIVGAGGGGRLEGHNYTVSINFNRPQQSKGKRPNRGNRINDSKKAWGQGIFR